MNEFDERLKKALQQKAPASDFAARVAVRISQNEAQSKWPTPRQISPWRWATVAVLIIATIGSIGYHQQQRERSQGEAARRQVMLALQITNEKLQIAQQKVRHLSDRRGEI